MLGIFDSGLGGLTVVKEILKRLPNRLELTSKCIRKGDWLTVDSKLSTVL
jgi:hypothetical protein